MSISPFASCPPDKYTYFYISISATFISWQFGFFSRSREIIIKSVYACNWHLLQQRHNELYSSSIIPHIHKSCAFAKGQERTQPFPISRKFLGEWLWKCWRCALKFSYLMLLRFFNMPPPSFRASYSFPCVPSPTVLYQWTERASKKPPSNGYAGKRVHNRE